MSTEDIWGRFQRDTADHTLQVLHDDGLYRHLRFRQPLYGAYWFDLITVPHALIFRGDGESFVFSRLEDMFEFFRGRVGTINVGYWAEKLTSDRDSVRHYDEDRFKARVTEAFVDAVRDGGAPRGLGKAVREQLLTSDDTAWEDGARRLLEDFEFGEAYDVRCPCGQNSRRFPDYKDALAWRRAHTLSTDCTSYAPVRHHEGFRFEDTWEWDFKDYDWWFLWALHGIRWGIAQYDQAKRPVEAVAVTGGVL